MKGDTMNSQSTEVIDEVSKWTVGLGILTVALAPLSIPILVLTAAALIPLAVPVLALGLVVAIVAVPVLLIRGLGRRVIAAQRPTRNVTEGRAPVAPVTGRLVHSHGLELRDPKHPEAGAADPCSASHR
jgi:hypothetical protein